MDFVLAGLQHGFHVGFSSSLNCFDQQRGTCPQPRYNPQLLTHICGTSSKEDRLKGSQRVPPLVNLHVSRFGVIPKKYQPGKWRLILDLSSPKGATFKDGIPKDTCSVQYLTVNSVIDGIITSGRGTVMAKIDKESTYENVAIHSEDRYLFGMYWQGQYFVDMTLSLWLTVSAFHIYFDSTLARVDLKYNHGVHFFFFF